MLVDGTVYDEDPQVRAANANFCAAFEDQLASGWFYDGQGTPGFKLVSHLAEVAPNDPTPLPGFPPGYTNHRVWVAVMAAPPLTPTSPRPGFAFLAGSVEEDRFFFADEALAHAQIRNLDDYYLIRIARDVSCGLAGERAFTSNLHNFAGPVLVFGAGRGYGPAMRDTAALFSKAKVTVNYKEEYGHSDYVYSADHLQELEAPILGWLNKEVFRRK